MQILGELSEGWIHSSPRAGSTRVLPQTDQLLRLFTRGMESSNPSNFNWVSSKQIFQNFLRFQGISPEWSKEIRNGLKPTLFLCNLNLLPIALEFIVMMIYELMTMYTTSHQGPKSMSEQMPMWPIKKANAAQSKKVFPKTPTLMPLYWQLISATLPEEAAGIGYYQTFRRRHTTRLDFEFCFETNLLQLLSAGSWGGQIQ